MLIFKAGNHIYSQVKQLHRRTLESIRNFLFGGYQKLPKASAFLPTCREPKVHESLRQEEYHNQDLHYVTMEEEAKEVESNGEKEAVLGSFLNFGNIRNGNLVHQDGEEKKTKKKKSVVFVVPEEKRNVEQELKFCERAEALEKKLKEIVEEGCEEADLMDIHEFMHYYKLLTCPFYIEMVDRFFIDMFG